MSVRAVWLASVIVAAAFAAVAPPAGAASTVIPFASPFTAVVDGVIAPGEYPGSFSDPVTQMTVWWAHDDLNLSVGFESPGTGWAALGIGPEGILMDRANILIGYVSGATTVIMDEFGVGLNHVSDIGRGGTDDILARGGNESAGKTVLELRIPLNSGDPYDIELRSGRTYSLILAYHDTVDDLVTLHTKASLTSVSLQRDPSKVPTRIPSLVLEGEGELREGRNLTLVARLLGDDSLPLPRQVVEFWANTSVGDGFLGVAETDQDGEASLNYTLLSPGPTKFVARYEGDLDYLPASANVTLVAASATDGRDRDYVGFFIQGLVAAAIAGVVVACIFSLDQVRLIRRVGRASRTKRGRGAPKRSKTE